VKREWKWQKATSISSIFPSNLPEDPNLILPSEKLLLQHPQYLCRPNGKQIIYVTRHILNLYRKLLFKNQHLMSWSNLKVVNNSLITSVTDFYHWLHHKHLNLTNNAIFHYEDALTWKSANTSSLFSDIFNYL
jgi:hypothetical protein